MIHNGRQMTRAGSGCRKSSWPRYEEVDSKAVVEPSYLWVVVTFVICCIGELDFPSRTVNHDSASERPVIGSVVTDLSEAGSRMHRTSFYYGMRARGYSG